MKGPLLAGLFTAAVLVAFAALAVDGLWRPDAFDYAQIARELAEGHGFVSRHAIYALHLEWLASHGLLASDWPNLHRFPLPSLLMAAGFRLFGAVDAVVVGYGVVLHAATSGLLFAWARSAVSLPAAVACVLLFTLNGALLEIGVSGLSEPPVILGVTAALYAAWRQERSGSLAPSLAAGLCLGLAGLARTNAVFAAPLFAVALALGGGWRGLAPAARRVAAFAAGILLVSLPWWIRNAQLTGDPFFSLHTYFLLPSGSEGAGLKWDLTVPWVRELTSPWAYLREHPGPVFAKWAHNLGRFVRELPSLAGLAGLVLLAALSLLPRLGGSLRATGWLVFAGLAWNALLVSFSDFFLPKYHLHWVPALILLGTAAVWRLSARISRPRWRAAALAAALLVVLDWGGAWRSLRQVPAAEARYDRAHFRAIREWTAPEAVVVSDQSHAVAWETGRRSIRLHYDRLADGSEVLGVLALNDAYLPVDAVYLSRQFLRDPAKLAMLRRTLARQPRFRRTFPAMHQFEEGGLLFLRATPRSPDRAGAPGSRRPPGAEAPEGSPAPGAPAGAG